jgi:AraC-like DNA-binding protein
MAVDTQAVKRLIQENLKVIHTVEDVARRINISPETLRKEFWRQEKITLGDFITNSKVEKAKRLLIETDWLCKEVCYEAGFRREDSAETSFRRRTGLSMQEFREKHRKHR